MHHGLGLLTHNLGRGSHREMFYINRLLGAFLFRSVIWNEGSRDRYRSKFHLSESSPHPYRNRTVDWQAVGKDSACASRSSAAARVSERPPYPKSRCVFLNGSFIGPGCAETSQTINVADTTTLFSRRLQICAGVKIVKTTGRGDGEMAILGPAI